MFLPHLLAPTMLLEEFCELDASPKEVLLAEIAKLGPEVVAYATTSNLRTVNGKTKPRDLIRFPWRTRRMQLWRLEQLVHPLWLGQDGFIYRAYEADGYSSKWSEPDHHWLRAELELRNVAGLERVLNALKALEPSTAGTSHI